ncbi:MAG: PSD1 and planctomycete cytochrome C domain-containing protein [Kiritimatiellia bacterium]|nr:PSD1 and planctomycete cytochrome C domain-containing protein [Kiritimatiellia bacterium]
MCMRSLYKWRYPAMIMAGTMILLQVGCSEPPPPASVVEEVDPDPVDFARQVLPVLSENCFFCHGPDRARVMAGLSLHTREYATAVLRSGATAVVPGNRDQSEMWKRINDSSNVMPPVKSHKSLTAQEIALLGRWIEEGAPYARHWAYQPLEKVKPPQVKNQRWPLNDIDRFVLKRLEDASVSPSDPAPRAVLARRLYLDLVGVPPTVEQLEAFKTDTSAGAYEKLVDQLLVDSRFGETLAAWWLDLVRYADSVGYHGDQSRPMWAYRNWVIRALNENMPFDEFSAWQLAGDLMPGATQEQIIAAAYNRLYSETAEGGAQDAEYIAIYHDDQVRNLSEVWLGASMGCARCHDHKYDPITTRDFYNMAAFFADMDVPIVSNQAVNRSHWAPFVLVPQDKKQAEMIKAVEERYRQLLEEHPAEAKQIEILHVTRDRDPPGAAKGSWQNEFRELVKKRIALADTVPALPITRTRSEPRTVRVLPRGNYLDESGEICLPSVPAFLGTLSSTETNRLTRMDLAKWLFSDENPKTSRVIVNRLWALYFGKGLARDQLDFGSQGDLPTHPWLLDFLAGEFRKDWDLKAMVRRMVVSRSYRQSSSPRPDLSGKDPDNLLLARQNSWRLSAEQLRDQALALSGLLKPQVGAAAVKPYQPAGHWEPLNFPARRYQASTGEDLYRRTVYTWVQRSFPNPLLTNFDAPNRETCLAGRTLTNTPIQALTTLNSRTYVEAARNWAVALLCDASDDDERLTRAFLQALGRSPADGEAARLQALLTTMRGIYKDSPGDAVKALAVGASPVDSGVDSIDAAAWTQVCRVMLNLNETLVRP